MSPSSDQVRRVLLTGAAGFIGAAVSQALLDKGIEVVGVDNLNPYYAVSLKKDRLAKLTAHTGFRFHEADIADHEMLSGLPSADDVDAIVHLAAQAGVRHSLENPFAYAHANLTGHLSVLELARHAKRKPRLVYASSSSVYGGNTKVPFSESDRTDTPVSLYAATKRADELMSETYSHLYGLEQVGLRFFTVYGPWGRPDMAYWSFTRNILAGMPIHVFNHGDQMRDFTYIDDIVAGVAAVVLDRPAGGALQLHRIYNIGNNRPERLTRFIEVLEQATGRKAEVVLEPAQPGDVTTTYADIDALARDYGFAPRTTLEQGIPKFVEWYRGYVAGGGAP
jgi:UDP-glucuronate 4-epimerase